MGRPRKQKTTVVVNDEKTTVENVVKQKTLSNTTANSTKKQVEDVKFWGDEDNWKLISKAWSKSEGWMKSTKAMQIKNVGVVLQVSTQQGENVSEALQFIPNVKIKEILNNKGSVVRREIVKGV